MTDLDKAQIDPGIEEKGRYAGVPELLADPASTVRQGSGGAGADGSPNHGVEPGTARSSLIFRYLREDKPLPSPARSRWIVFSLYLIMTLAGWDTGSSAPLLPFLQEYYNINFLIMSMIFVTMFIGSCIAAGLNVYLTDRLGFGLVSALGTVAFALGYAISSSGGPYPLFALSFVLNGIGFGFQDAQINAITARLPNPNTKMSLLHAFFGLGGTIAPFISTPFVQRFPTRPTLFYLVNLAVALITLGVEVGVFRGRTEEQLTGRKDEASPAQAQAQASGGLEGVSAAVPLGDLKASEVQAAVLEHGQAQARHDPDASAIREEPRPGTGTDIGAETPDHLRRPTSSSQKMKRIMTSPAVYVFVLHSFLYVGVETTIGGWAPTYLINVRGADANAGYVTSGFWGGLTIGRILLIPITKWLGNRWSVLVYSILSLALQVLTWVIPNYYASATFICFTGFFLAPIFPSAIVLLTELIPDELHVGVIGMYGTIGGAGAAAVPFILGGIADRFGFWVMAPTMVAGLAASIILWLFVPRHRTS